MKSNSLIALFAGLVMLCSAGQCHEDSLSNGEEDSNICGKSELPDWINTIIGDTQQNGNKGEVVQYQFEGKTVFWINTCLDCADSMTQVFDCQGNVKCVFGGIAGFNTCPDFTQKATHKKIIWAN
ncbi:MAG TPA: hypothetical protein VFW11_00210 [Cyclobacteriaceae bacterium]|nr:hypothetical protein [Cyclobacteriaceae bacterium]